jgi:hypothetical protein
MISHSRFVLKYGSLQLSPPEKFERRWFAAQSHDQVILPLVPPLISHPSIHHITKKTTQPPPIPFHVPGTIHNHGSHDITTLDCDHRTKSLSSRPRQPISALHNQPPPNPPPSMALSHVIAPLTAARLISLVLGKAPTQQIKVRAWRIA